LSRKIGVDVELCVALVKAMKYDVGAVADVGRFCLGIKDASNPTDQQNSQNSAIKALTYLSNTTADSWKEIAPHLQELECRLLGERAREGDGQAGRVKSMVSVISTDETYEVTVNDSGEVEYFQGETLLYTSKVKPQFPLYVGVSIMNQNGQFVDVEWTGAKAEAEP